MGLREVIAYSRTGDPNAYHALAGLRYFGARSAKVFHGGLVRLTVIHADLERDPQMLAGISGGWPKVLSNLKTLLETGRALPRSPSTT